MINSSFLTFAFGIQGYEGTSYCYKDSKIVLNIQKRADKMCCPECKSRNGQSQLASATLRKIFEKRFGWGEKI